MYALSVFIGIANALILVTTFTLLYVMSSCVTFCDLTMYLLIIKILQVTAISMQSVLVGSELGGCAFVCGSLSFLDKMSCGLALYVLQSHQSKFFVYLFFRTLS